MVQFIGGGLMLHHPLSGLVHHALDCGPRDAEAYRADDSLNDGNPFEVACRPDLLNEAASTVIEVVAAVTTWPAPGALSSFF
jgi:hypothetical protein